MNQGGPDHEVVVIGAGIGVPLRWTQPVMRVVFTVGIRYGLRRLIRRRAERDRRAVCA